MEHSSHRRRVAPLLLLLARPEAGIRMGGCIAHADLQLCGLTDELWLAVALFRSATHAMHNADQRETCRFSCSPIVSSR